MKYSFLYYIQLLIISQVIWATKVNWNVEKGTLSHQNWNAHFWITFNFWWSAKWSEWWKSIKMQKWNVVSVRFFCCFSLDLLYAAPSLPLDDKVGIRVTKKFCFFRFTFNKFQPKDNSVQSLLHLLAMHLICDRYCTNWFNLHFYNL